MNLGWDLGYKNFLFVRNKLSIKSNICKGKCKTKNCLQKIGIFFSQTNGKESEQPNRTNCRLATELRELVLFKSQI